MPPVQIYNLFISHAWRHDADYNSLVKLLSHASLFNWRNHSVPKDAPLVARDLRGIQEELAHRIFLANALLVVSEMYVDRREWVQYEIGVARALDRPIIGIEPRQAGQTSAHIQTVATTTVGWNTDSIGRAIRIFSL